MTAVDDESALPGEPASIWLDTSRETDYPRLDGDVWVDVAVIGGGIAGLTTAARLAEAGSDVALVEADRIVGGVTARTTAKITSQHGLVYSNLIEAVGEEDAKRYAEANQAAIDAIAARVREGGDRLRLRATPRLRVRRRARPGGNDPRGGPRGASACRRTRGPTPSIRRA